MTVRLAWRTAIDDPHLHGWTGERECGWPCALCGYSCPDDEIEPTSDGKLCPRCVYHATAHGFPVPPGDVCPHSRGHFWRWLWADWLRIACACLLFGAVAALAAVPVLVFAI